MDFVSISHEGKNLPLNAKKILLFQLGAFFSGRIKI